MLLHDTMRVGYVVKRYPRYSETFIVNEILGHEAAGLDIDIFSLCPPTDTHFQDSISQVRARVTYLPDDSPRAETFWTTVHAAAADLPRLWMTLDAMAGENVGNVYQAVCLAQKARERGVTLLHAHFGTVAATVARLAAMLAGIPYTFTAHAKDIFHETVNSEALGRKLRDAAAVITVSDYNVRYLHDVYGHNIAPITRVYNGIDLDRFEYRAPQDRPARIIAVGRLVEKKGFDVLVDACSILDASGLPFECDIIGAGPLEADLRSQIDRLGVAHRVRLLGPRPQREVIEHIRGGAVFAAPCIEGTDGNRDGLPTVLLEAMALGTPCVSTDVTGIPEVIRDEETGLLVPQRDPVALAHALKRLITDANLRTALACNARELIETEFDVHWTTAQLRDVFSSIGRPALVLAGD